MWVKRIGWLAFVGFILGHHQPAWADNADRVRRVTKAATDIAAVQNKRGADGAFAAIMDCYKRELAVAKRLTHEVEACMAQDIIVSKVSAAVYGSISAEARKMAGAPEPKALLDGMVQRVIGGFRRFKVAEADAKEFMQVVDKHGMAAYGNARHPGQFPQPKR